jgi:Protein of unknown function (DUF2971)
MRVFHFVNKKYGLEDIQRRRLKIATLPELNDPFELFGINLSNPELRCAFRATKEELSINRGILCFSKSWHNPVQWSHYAEKHTGLCLGFDVPDEHLAPVNYSGRRLAVAAQTLLNPSEIDAATAKKFLFTKFAHWRYENEVRCFLSLDERDEDSGLYFAEFSDRLALKQVIVGAESNASREVLNKVLGDLAGHVEVIKARLAFASFSVVRQKNDSLWR